MRAHGGGRGAPRREGVACVLRALLRPSRIGVGLCVLVWALVFYVAAGSPVG